MILHPAASFLARWTLRLVAVAVFAGIPAALVTAKYAGIGFGMPTLVGEALSGGPVRVEVGRLAFDPAEGLVAEKVRLVSKNQPGRTLATIDRLSVSPNLAALADRRIVIDRAALAGARAEIPVSAPDGGPERRLALEDVTAELFLQGGTTRVPYFAAEVQGIRVRASGELAGLDRPIPKAGGGAGGAGDSARWLYRALDALAGVRFDQAAPPTLEFTFGGDLADPGSLAVDPFSLTSGKISGKDWSVDGIEASGGWANGRLSLNRLAIQGEGGGRLQLWAVMANGTVEFEAESSLDPAGLRGILPFPKVLGDLRLNDPPGLVVRGSAPVARPADARLSGEITLGRFGFRGVDCDSLHTEFAWRDRSLFVREARLRAGGGEVTADVLTKPGDFRLQARSDILPTLVAPVLDARAREIVDAMEFREPPLVTVSLRGTSPSMAQIQGAGRIRLGRTALRGVWLEHAETPFEIARGAITYRNFKIQRKQGSGTGTFTYDFARQLIRLEDVHSTMDPYETMMWIDPKIAQSIKPYRFRKNPAIDAEGTVYMKELSRNDMRLKVSAPGGVDYDLLGKTLNFGDTRADVHIDGASVKANVTRAALFGGQARVRANISVDPAKPVFEADTSLTRADFAKITKLYFDFDTSKGLVSGTYKFSARMGNESDMKGSGSVRVEDGNVFAIPLLGPLSDILNSIIKGAGYEAARLATADYTIADQKIHTDNLVIEGRGFSLYGYGDIFFTRDKMDLSVRINARGIPGIVLFPVSKLFEYVSTGSVSNPEWRPKLIPRIKPHSP